MNNYRYYVRYVHDYNGWMVMEESNSLASMGCRIISGPHATEYLANNRKRYREMMQEKRNEQ